MVGMRYHGNVMTTTRWRLYIIKKTIITRSVYTSNSKSTVWACYRCILHLQQYSHILNFIFPPYICISLYSDCTLYCVPQTASLQKTTNKWKQRKVYSASWPLWSVLFTNYPGDQIKKNWMGGACGTHGGRGELRAGFRWGNMREGNNLGNLDVDRRIVLKWIFKGDRLVVDWFDLAQDRDVWWALVSVVVVLRVGSNVGNLLTS